MSARDDLLVVVELAALTADRTTKEQRALLETAVRLELDLNRSTTLNLKQRYGQEPSTIVDAVMEGQVLGPSALIWEKLHRKRASFARDVANCDEHGRMLDNRVAS